jgi:hypothetical protein
MTTGAAPDEQQRERGLDELLGDAVEVGGRLVEEQDARFLEGHSRDRQALLLPAGEAVSALTDDRVVAVGKRGDEVVHVGRPGGGGHLLLRGVGKRVEEVLADRGVKQERVLEHDPDVPAQRLQGEVADVVPVEQNAPRPGGRRSAGSAS